MFVFDKIGNVFSSKIWVFALLLLASTPAFAQDDDGDDETTYQSEYNYGVTFSTNGGLIGGVSFKYAYERKPGWYNRFQLEFAYLKHPKEYHFPGVVSNYIPNKFQYLVAIRPSFGQEYVLFSKAPEEGVQLNAIFGAGPTFGITKPYYVLYTDDPYGDVTYSRPYTPALLPDHIVGVGAVTDGFDQLGVVPGFHFRAGFAFESGRYRSSVFGLEGGFVSEFYTHEIQLLKFSNTSPSTVKNPSSFHSLYLILYYGFKN